jgi:hypothetical protein
MSDHYPADRPGHLDIDAVSAFVDRDFAPDDLATIAFHLSQCPACQREVLEIHTTVVLLAGLPQYAPRRSFCLGREYARMRRGRRARAAAAWVFPVLPASQMTAAGVPAAGAGSSGTLGGVLAGLQAAAMTVGALLLLLTAGDFMLSAEQPVHLSAALAPQATQSAGAPMPAMRAAPPAVTATAAPIAFAPAAAPSSGNVLPGEPVPEQGTDQGSGASEELQADEASRQVTLAPPAATGAVVIALTMTPSAAAPKIGPAGDVASDDRGAVTSPSRLRLIQIGLGLLLAWLVVTIIGLSRVRARR